MSLNLKKTIAAPSGSQERAAAYRFFITLSRAKGQTSQDATYTWKQMSHAEKKMFHHIHPIAQIAMIRAARLARLAADPTSEDAGTGREWWAPCSVCGHRQTVQGVNPCIHR